MIADHPSSAQFRTTRPRHARLSLACALLLTLMVAAAPARSGESVLSLAPGQARLLELARPAGSVVVANPAHLRALLDSPRRLILIPGRLGATSLTVLDREGAVLLSRLVSVSGRPRDHVTVIRGCAEAASSACRRRVILNCAQGCVDVTPPDARQGGGAGGAAGGTAIPAAGPGSGTAPAASHQEPLP